MKASLRYLAVAALMLCAWAFMRNHHDKPTPLAVPLSDFPLQVGLWHLVKDSQFDQRTLEVLKPTEYLAKRYAMPAGNAVDLYVGYHDGARNAGPLHSPKNCLPGSGWYEVSSRRVSIPVPGGTQEAVAAVYQSGAVSELFLYWFQVGGEPVTDEYSMKAMEVLNSIRYGRRDTAFIRLSVPLSGPGEQALEQALGQAREFLRAVHSDLKRFLPT